MKLNVKLMSIFAEYSKEDNDGKTEVKDGGTVNDLIEKLGIPQKTVRIIAVNGKQCDKETVLNENDTVFLFPPAAGGG